MLKRHCREYARMSYRLVAASVRLGLRRYTLLIYSIHIFICTCHLLNTAGLCLGTIQSDHIWKTVITGYLLIAGNQNVLIENWSRFICLRFRLKEKSVA